jgi:hypothetical protein
VLKRIRGPGRNEVRRGCRKLHDEDLHILNSSLNIIRKIAAEATTWTGHEAQEEDTKNA